MTAPAFDVMYNQVVARLETAFFDRVADRVSVLQTRVNELVKEMFEDISLSFGSDEVPSEISGYTAWDDLTEKWIDEKKSGSNRFYLGKSKGLGRQMKNRSKKFVYGVPEITIGTTLGRGFSNASGRTRIAKGFAGAGRFASPSAALVATISIVPFPKLTDDVTKPFGVKVGAGEYGTSNRPARPFLFPFIRFYTEVKVPQIINQVIR